jgi:hypothetical protein
MMFSAVINICRCSLIFAFFALSSCSHIYYFPTAHNVPLLKERNDAKFTAGASFKPVDISVCEFQVAWAATNHVALAGSYTSASGTSSNSASEGNGHYADAAIGYFSAINEELIFEVFGGFGHSNQHHQYGTSRKIAESSDRQIIDFGTSDLSFSNYYIQPAIGVSRNAFDIVFSLRFSNLYFNGINNNLLTDTINKYTYNSPLFFPLEEIASQRRYYLLEPGFTLRAGWQYAKLQLQWVHSVHLNTSRPESFHNSHFTIGLSFAFAERWMKK